ncbi:Valine--tRNA ligase [Fundidesulfovibrio magnetotacticus]|uniref:Valine--tRNA ligase n=1 Tax=Fundidesulfovibrio magnetotacticus TaxID=2730080 RepID=A0A6V8LX55_9BACT|nr:valine--tRNA ligase [Fundidesulfovibrio magnetotacticus]GFK92865.1 Valine--tRNA ligase [Fundidesulfovibrio magnetotacticus]
MSDTTLAKGYEPAEVEARWLEFWRESGAGTADPQAQGEPFSIVIPPPNVTGALHMGHALNLTIQDILCRHMRQKGRKVLWVPGTDHAGIATQNVVERSLGKEGVTRQALGREAFVEKVWEWRKDYGGRILNQIRRMGASVDWTRERFTMDEGLSRAVREVFVRLYEEGLIYKGDYIINWCPRCQTALADLEVEHAPKKGGLYQIRYPLADGSGELVVATTRPETMLGDTAVAVHPEDERYAAFVGRMVRLPLTDRLIPVIADAYVDREFGTGALKVTPAHDMNDFELGRRHALELLQVMDGQGRMNAAAGPDFAGLTREECRKKVLEALQEQGFLVKKEEHDHSVGECYRCKTVIEPHVSPQWFVKAGPLAQVARKAVEDGRTRIVPDQWTSTYYHWLDNIRDWCISRQIWWGHRIPAWTCQACGQLVVSREDPAACACGGALNQDEDVLDTWFSSALWPFSTLGWPDKTPELAAFYPTSVLVTAFDILFFWVARMMMMGQHFMGEVPFRDVYIHALVRDGEGKKMSKSTGNVIDPLVMIDKFGTDALRFTLAAFAAMGRDIRLSEDRIEGYRHFVNKLWNAARFSLMNLPAEIPAADLDAEGLPLHHAWILHRLEAVKAATGPALEGYHFNEAAQGLYSFLWLEFCDWYLEMIKTDFSGDDPQAKAVAERCLWTVLSELLTLLHPFMPFVTQEIWSHLPGHAEKDLSKVAYPAARPACVRPEAEAAMNLVREVVVSVRNIRSELSISPGLKLDCLVRTADAADLSVLLGNERLIMSLARLATFTAGPGVAAPKASASAAAGGNAVFVPLAGAVDFDAELARLGKELAKTAKEAEIVGRKLANEDFTARAPAEVVAKEREKGEMLREKVAKLEELRARIEGLRG